MSIKQIEADIAAGRYVNPLDAAEQKLKNIETFVELQQQRDSPVREDFPGPYVSGYRACLRDIKTLLKGA